MPMATVVLGNGSAEAGGTGCRCHDSRPGCASCGSRCRTGERGAAVAEFCRPGDCGRLCSRATLCRRQDLRQSRRRRVDTAFTADQPQQEIAFGGAAYTSIC